MLEKALVIERLEELGYEETHFEGIDKEEQEKLGIIVYDNKLSRQLVLLVDDYSNKLESDIIDITSKIIKKVVYPKRTIMFYFKTDKKEMDILNDMNYCLKINSSLLSEVLLARDKRKQVIFKVFLRNPLDVADASMTLDVYKTETENIIDMLRNMNNTYKECDTFTVGVPTMLLSFCSYLHYYLLDLVQVKKQEVS